MKTMLDVWILHNYYRQVVKRTGGFKVFLKIRLSAEKGSLEYIQNGDKTGSDM